MMIPYTAFVSQDKSQLFKAWTSHYKEMGLSANKIIKKVLQKTKKGKLPKNI